MMGKFINHDKASEFEESITDPIVRRLVKSAYTTILMSDVTVEGEFDLFYFSKIMEAFLHDRECLAKALAGDFENRTGWGD